MLDLPAVGRDRDDTWARVERLRGRTAAAAYAERTHAGTAPSSATATAAWPTRGVDTVFRRRCADLEGRDDVEPAGRR